MTEMRTISDTIGPCRMMCRWRLDRCHWALARGTEYHAKGALFQLAPLTHLENRCKHFSHVALLVARAYFILGLKKSWRRWLKEALRATRLCRGSRRVLRTVRALLRIPGREKPLPVVELRFDRNISR